MAFNLDFRKNSFLKFYLKKNSGDYGGGETPLPIPNRVVKTSCADGTALETRWESRTLPEIILYIKSLLLKLVKGFLLFY